MASTAATISRCFCPPDRVLVFQEGNNSIRSQVSVTRLRISSGSMLRFSHPKAISSSTFVWMICSSAFWSTTPTFRQNAPVFLPSIEVPSTRTSPVSVPGMTFGMMPQRMERTVLFPCPEYPESRVTRP